MLVKFEKTLWSELYKVLNFFDKKWLTIFDKSVDTILEDVPVTETLVVWY